jgi:hypothetical protein
VEVSDTGTSDSGSSENVTVPDGRSVRYNGTS